MSQIRSRDKVSAGRTRKSGIMTPQRRYSQKEKEGASALSVRNKPHQQSTCLKGTKYRENGGGDPDWGGKRKKRRRSSDGVYGMVKGVLGKRGRGSYILGEGRKTVQNPEYSDYLQSPLGRPCFSKKKKDWRVVAHSGKKGGK